MRDRSLFLLLACWLLAGPCLGQAFWWENVKALKLTTKSFDKVVGQDKYVLIEFFTKGCIYCKQFYPDFNKVYDDFMGKNPIRKDIIIAKLDADEDREIATRYGISSYPTIILLFPNDYRFPQKYLYDRDHQIMTNYLTILPATTGAKLTENQQQKFDDAIKGLQAKLQEAKEQEESSKKLIEKLIKDLKEAKDRPAPTTPSTPQNQTTGPALNGISSTDLIEINKLLEDQQKQFSNISKKTIRVLRKRHAAFQEEFAKKVEEIKLSQQASEPSQPEAAPELTDKPLKGSSNRNSLTSLLIAIAIGAVGLFIAGQFFPTGEILSASE